MDHFLLGMICSQGMQDMNKYCYYLVAYNDIYKFDNYEDCDQHIADVEMGSGDDDFIIMVEMVISRKSGERYCKEYNKFTNYTGCGKKWCEKYEPRNGKNGICKYQTWGRIETGREWKVFKDGSYEKISGRKK